MTRKDRALLQIGPDYAPIADLQVLMKALKANRPADRQRALTALKVAVVAGATGRYAVLVQAAYAAGASEDEIDLTVHEAIEALFEGAEQPVTARDLAPRRNSARLCSVT